MSLLVNGAGVSAADPILNGLGIALICGASSMDIAVVNDVFLDTATGFPGTTTVKSSLSPAATVVTAGSAGSYNDTTDQLTISSTTGLSAGDYIYISHGTITDGFYRIASVVDGTDVTLDADPLAGGGNVSSVSYQAAWTYQTTAPNSDAAGDENFFKADLEDGSANNTQSEDTFFARNAPSGSSYIAINGGDYTGQTIATFTPTLAILSGWANNGGISHVEMANHSVQTVNNFTWTTGGGTGEVTLATAEGGLTAAATDGAKYGRLLFKSAAGGQAVGVDIDVTIDSSGPTVVLQAAGY